MLMPDKHIRFSESLFGFGSYLLEKLQKPCSVDDLWQEYQKDFENKNYDGKQSFDNLLLTLLFLYSVEAIYEKDGEIYLCA